MTPRELVDRYFEIFFETHDFDSLNEILSEDLEFNGPLASFNSAQDYIDSLKQDPPVDCQYEILFDFEDEQGIDMIYRFTRPGVSLEISQLFQFNSAKISRILLIFDSARL
jgi:hypothetical protein